jgi:Flp pilus assembly CpaF family ATPase
MTITFMPTPSQAPVRAPVNDSGERERTLAAMFYRMLGPTLAALCDDPQISEIMINHARDVWVERHGVMTRLDLALTPSQVRSALGVAATAAQSSLGMKPGEKPWVQARIEHLRVAGMMHPVAILGDTLTIRLHHASSRSLADYVRHGRFAALAQPYCEHRVTATTQHAHVTFDQHVADTLTQWVRQGTNLLVSGVPSGGKTSALRALLAMLPHATRVIVVEDTHEIAPPTANGVALVAHAERGVTLRDLIHYSLRARPDLIVAGELRGSEAADFLTAMNAGTKAMATLHADGPREALFKLEALALQSPDVPSARAVRQTIAALVQVVLHMGRRGSERGLFLAAMRVAGLDDHGDYILEDLFTSTLRRSPA